MRLATYSDVEYHRDDAGTVWADESFVLFMAHLARFSDRLVLLGRVAPEPGTAAYAVPPDAELAELPHYPALSRPWEALRAMAGSLRRFWGVLRDVDAVWLLGPHPLALGFCLLALARRRRVVLGVRQDFPTHMRTRHPGRRDLQAAADILEGVWRLLGRRLPVVVVGPDLARNYPGPATLPIAISVVDPEAVTTVEQAERERSYDGELTALSVGRIDPEKNPLLLVDVLAALRTRDPRWRLIVCGDGTMRDAVRERAEAAGVAEWLELPGFLSPAGGLTDLYRSSHAFLHVSWTEGVPQVLFEAYAAGLPVVATAVGGVPEIAGDDALLIPPGDAEAAVSALERVAMEPALRRRLIEAGIASVDRHSLDRECARVAELLGGERVAAP